MKQTELTERGFSRSALFGLTAAATLFIVGCSQLQGGSEPAPQSVDSSGISDDPGGEGQDNGGGGGGGSSTRESNGSSSR